MEVAARDSSKFAPTDIGVPLMRKAFDKTNGPLTYPLLQEAEKDAMAHLFAGAIGLYKNPQSHRNVSISDAAEAAELIIIASHLLHTIDLRLSMP